MDRLRKSVAVFVFVLMVCGTCGSLALAQDQPPTAVNVVEAKSCEVSATVMLVGTVLPNTRSLIAGELAGLVQELPVEEGDRVESDQVIGRLRDRTQKLAVEEARGTLAQLQAELDELEAGTRVEEKDQAKAMRDEANALHEKWKAEVARIKDLREGNSASAKEYNDAVWDASAARARLEQTAAAYDEAVAGPRKEEIARARHAVASQKAVVERLEYDLKRMEIRAPFNGYVIVKHTEVGQWLSMGGAVVEMIDLDHVRIRVDVPEAYIPAAVAGAPVVVQVDALQTTIRGAITRVIPQANTQARAFPVEIVLDNKSGSLKAGMFVRVRVPSGPRVESLIVPRDAVLLRRGAYFVVTVAPSPAGQGEMAMPVPVNPGSDIGDWIAVSSPMLMPGAKVAVKGHDRIYAPQPAKSEKVELKSPDCAGALVNASAHVDTQPAGTKAK